MKEMGSVMKAVMAEVGDLADSKILSQTVKAELGA